MIVASYKEDESRCIDFADEDDVEPWPLGERRATLGMLAAAIDAALANPPAERLRDGIRVVIAGPPNAGKSSLFNVLIDRDAAIVAPVPYAVLPIADLFPMP